MATILQGNLEGDKGTTMSFPMIIDVHFWGAQSTHEVYEVLRFETVDLHREEQNGNRRRFVGVEAREDEALEMLREKTVAEVMVGSHLQRVQRRRCRFCFDRSPFFLSFLLKEEHVADTLLFVWLRLGM